MSHDSCQPSASRYSGACLFTSGQLSAADEQLHKLKKRLKAISKEIQAVEDGLNSVNAEASGQSDNDQPSEKSLQQTNQQGDLQRAPMLERLSALEAKHAQLQVGCAQLLSPACQHWCLESQDVSVGFIRQAVC